MKPSALPLPTVLLAKVGEQAKQNWTAIGNPDLLQEPLIGLIASRQCPGSVFLKTIDRIPQWIKEGRVILSGFHSPLEQQVLHSALRRKGRAVKLLARGLAANYRIPPKERAPLTEGRLLILTACPPEVRRITRATALERNRLILALATDTEIPHVAENSPLAALIAERHAAKQ